ncbi:amino acid ABC transporter permease [Chitinimonas sp.]|uniref:amino acid ABC transporter permease n=1 Tax=Chitinimonas sp. TaxID=1934313 RepID=UPI0035B01B27
MGQYHWNWMVIFEKVAGTEEYYYQWLLHGLGWTLAVAVGAWTIAMILGSAIGVARTAPIKWLSAAATAYVELFRNIPLIVQLFLWFFVLPEMLPEHIGTWMKQGMPYPEFITGMIGLGLFTAARVAEQVRTGITVLPRGQKNAGLAMGLTLPQTYRYVLMPMAYRVIIPPLTSEFMNAFKNSSVCLAIGLTELTFQMKQITGEYAAGNAIEVMTIAGAAYLIMAFSVNRLMAWVEVRVRVPGFISAGGK